LGSLDLFDFETLPLVATCNASEMTTLLVARYDVADITPM